jgi:carbon storage regulator CsrA
MSEVKRLVLTRKKNETIVCTIGDTRIIFSVNDIRKTNVSITVEAIPEVKILRGELPLIAVQEKQKVVQEV